MKQRLVWLLCLPLALPCACGDDGAGGGGRGAGTAAGEGSRAGDPEAWVVERLDTVDPEDPVPARESLGNVSRPLAHSASFQVTLTSTPGAFLEFELGYHGAVHTTPPADVKLLARVNSATTDLPVEAVGRDGGTTPWHRYRAELAGAPAGAAELVVQVREDPAPPEGQGWRISLPRLYQERNQAARPNVLLITVDTLRADYLGVYGHDRPTSPRIDAFAATATTFDRAISQGPWTLPSYASMFTGLYPESHGVVHRPQRLDGKFTVLAESFAAAGYTTAAFVTGTFTDSEWGFDQGFDQYDDFGMVTDDNGLAVEDPTADDSMKSAERRITSPEVTDKAIAWLDAHRDRSFFLMAHYFDPHSDLMRHEGFSERFPPRPAEFRLKLVPGEMPPEVPAERALYEGEIAFTDHHIGRLLEHLDRSGLADHTIVVFCADHGEEYFERTRVGHGHALWDELLHVPLMVRAPGVKPSRVGAPVANVDVLPTLAELCDVETKQWPHAGESLVPLMTGQEEARQNPVLSVRFPGVAPPGQTSAPWNYYRVDQGDQSYIWMRQGNQVLQFLFDNAADPEQRVNIAKDHPADLQRFQEYRARVLPELERVRAEIGKPISVEDFDSMQEKLANLGYVGGADEVPIDPGAGDQSENEDGE